MCELCLKKGFQYDLILLKKLGLRQTYPSLRGILFASCCPILTSPNYSSVFFTLKIDVTGTTLNGPLCQLPEGGFLFHRSQGLVQELYFIFLLDSFFSVERKMIGEGWKWVIQIEKDTFLASMKNFVRVIAA